ncbi:MAG: hypothetical protein KatS3mg077_0118 [Candidatus Binatia bacterium]|nr:MAG: hypothetical protein KatS3mg077_0118 [Candidatus Binatia bacterium]
MSRFLLALLTLGLFASVSCVVVHSACAFTEETESGHELDEQLPPPMKGSLRRRADHLPSVGYDIKKVQRFWRNYKPPRRPKQKEERPKEYVDPQ